MGQLPQPRAGLPFRSLLCALAAGTGFVVTLVCFYPGYMWFDSISQLRDARTGYLLDWHPPQMSFVWGLLDGLLPGPLGLLVIQNVLFWAALGLLVWMTALPRWLAPLVVLGVGFAPPIFAFLGVLLKDMQMGVALLLAYAALRYADRAASKAFFLIGVLSLFYGLAVRHNAVAAALPLALLAGVAAARQVPVRRGRLVLTRAGLGLAILVGLILMVSLTTRLLTVGNAPTHPEQQILLHDLVAVSVETGQVSLPSYMVAGQAPFTVQQLRGIYTPGDVGPLFWGDVAARRLALKYEWYEGELDDLQQRWLTAVAQHPLVYLEHRLNVFGAQFTIGRERTCSPYYQGAVRTVSNELGFTPAGTALYRWVLDFLELVRNTLLFRGWFYLVATSVLLLACWTFWRERFFGVAVLGLSGLFYALAYVLVSTNCEFRMSWWTVVATVVLPVALFIPRGPHEDRVEAPDR